MNSYSHSKLCHLGLITSLGHTKNSVLFATSSFTHSLSLSLSLSLSEVSSKVVDTIPVLAIPISMYRIIMYTDIEIPTFRTSLNTGHILTIPAYFGHYRAYRPVQKKIGRAHV